jgi:hypothetical protein
MPTRIPFEATVTDTAYLSVMADNNVTCIGILFSDVKHQLLVYADNVNLGDNIKKNRETLTDASKEVLQSYRMFRRRMRLQ